MKYVAILVLLLAGASCTKNQSCYNCVNSSYDSNHVMTQSVNQVVCDKDEAGLTQLEKIGTSVSYNSQGQISGYDTFRCHR